MMIQAKAPLSDIEIRQAVTVVRRDAGLDASAWFETISLDESERHPQQRGAYVCCYEPVSNRSLNGIVLFDSDSLHDWRHVEGAQARIVPDEFLMACELAREHQGFLTALRKRGLEDASRVLVESWSAGNFGNPEERQQRIAYGHCWLMNDAGDNPYARPIANLHPVFDLAAGEIIRIDDFGVVPIPPDPGPIRRPQHREDLREIAITQPEGPSFEVDGYQVKWHNWELQVGFAQRDGLVLYDIGIHDQGRRRSIMKRASLAEMVVPYGDPRAANFRRNAFDTGEYGIGVALDSLTLGCDCLGHIHYFDIHTHDWQGEPRLVKNAVCMHEEDYGIQWKYSVPAANQSTVTRSRRLVVSSIATIGNYVYGFFWYFYLDGTIGVEVKATGIPFPSALQNDRTSPYGRQIGNQVESHVHQHVFSFRFDMALDGERNSVTEMNFKAAPEGPDNPYGNAILTEETRFHTEQQAQREIDSRQSRYWRVIESEPQQPLRRTSRLQAAARQQQFSAAASRFIHGTARSVHVQAPVGNPPRRRRTLPCRLVSEPACRRRWPAAMDRRRIVPSTTQISSSGTRSTTITGRGPRTGRCSRRFTLVFTGCRTVFSMKTRPWTCPTARCRIWAVRFHS